MEPVILVKDAYPKTHSFPRFANGTIYISLGSDKYTYALERDIFLRAFPTISQSLDIYRTAEEKTATGEIFRKHGYGPRLDVIYNENCHFWKLRRVVSITLLRGDPHLKDLNPTHHTGCRSLKMTYL